jgi:hypothetical protein
LDNRIAAAKQRLLLVEVTAHLWNIPNFEADLMEPHSFQYLMNELHQYLCFMRHLVGKKSRVVVAE